MRIAVQEPLLRAPQGIQGKTAPIEDENVSKQFESLLNGAFDIPVVVIDHDQLPQAPAPERLAEDYHDYQSKEDRVISS